MLTACGGSGSERPETTPDPVIETRTQIVRVCPSELQAATPPRPEPAAGAQLTGNSGGLEFLNAVLAWAGLLQDRLADAAAQCPAAPAGGG